MKERGFDFGEISGFLDEGTDFNGELVFRETMRIDGKFRGKISSTSVLIVGETADIEGDLVVSNVSINGKVKGSITADKKIEIHSKGKVYCDISTPNLVIEDGAFFEGNCNMDGAKKKEEEKKAASAVAPAPPRSFEQSLPRPEVKSGDADKEKK